MNIRLTAVIAIAGLMASGHANAVPCGVYSTYGGIQEASACRNGLDSQDSEDDLNGGSFFGFNDWTTLAQLTPATPNGADFWSVTPPSANARSGTLTLASGIWDQFASLVVVLRDGGSWHDSSYHWGAYLLPTEQYGTYHWSYDGGHKKPTNMTLYGRVTATPVPEPSALALVLTGLAGLAVTWKRRQKA